VRQDIGRIVQCYDHLVLTAIVAELRVAWPTTTWDAAMIQRHFESVEPTALDGPHRHDMLWAWACLACDPEALAQLESGPITSARNHLRTMGLPPSVAEDAAQRALARLVTDRAALASYRGRGPLHFFVRTVVVRFALEEHSKARPNVELTDMFATPSPDPELEYMRRLYAEHLATAFKAGWDRLGAHERFILALQLHEGMTIEDLAQVYSVHRATAARRAASARSSLLAHIRACLRERLAVSDETLDSILRVITTSVHLPLEVQR
jgi:RNA polymerase sigma-70 factor, ECF subfamily